MIRTRFAPSPTGYLHIGNLRTALFNYLIARKTGAQFILRLDDTDRDRSKEEYADGIKTDLEWLGLLRSCTAFEAYCKVYSADLRFEEIAEFLLLNDSFPFSINFAASMLQSALEDIADTTDTRRHNPIVRRIGRLKATLDYEQIDELLAADLSTTLLAIQSQCAQIHTDIFHAYIAYPVEEKLTTMSY